MCTRRKKAKGIGRKCLLKLITDKKDRRKYTRDGKMKRKTEQLLDDLEEARRYWKLKEKTLDHTLWRTRFGRGYGLVIRQTTWWCNDRQTWANLQVDVRISFTSSESQTCFVARSRWVRKGRKYCCKQISFCIKWTIRSLLVRKIEKKIGYRME